MKKVAVVGTGYVGLVTGACLAEIGNKVVCIDRDKSKIETLEKGQIPIYEPGLKALVARNRKNGRLSFATRIKDGVKGAEIIFIAVNTPPKEDGGADLSFVEACTREVAESVKGYALLVEKSTVPVQTGDQIRKTLSLLNSSSATIEVASNPEFLKEGSAVKDFMKPDRLVVGVRSKKAEKLLRQLYAKLKAPMIVTDINSAELIKHASNSFLALKISYINAIARICDAVGADVNQVALGMGLDPRIGQPFLNAGIGYGGSCFPKDVSAFIKIAEKNGYDFDLLKAAEHVNETQRLIPIKLLEEKLWTVKDKTIALLGLSFKPNTDDLRNAASIDIAKALIAMGAKVRAHDPVSMARMKEFYPDLDLTYVKDPYQALKNADAAVLVTEWEEYKKLNLNKVKRSMNTPVFIDGRNLFDPKKMEKVGFHYASIGRPETKN